MSRGSERRRALAISHPLRSPLLQEVEQRVLRLGVLLALGLLDVRLNVRAGQRRGRRLQGGAEGLVVRVLLDRAHADVSLGLLLEQLKHTSGNYPRVVERGGEGERDTHAYGRA